MGGVFLSRLRVKIKKIRPFVKRIATVVKLIRKNHYDVKCLDLMIDAVQNKDNPLIISFVNRGDRNKDCNIAVIKFDEQWVKTAGFFALLNKTICGLYFSDRLGFIPFVDKWQSCPYEKRDYDQSEYVFNYYFNPVSKITIDDVNNSRNITYLSDANYNLILDESNADWFSYSKLRIEKMAFIVNKYLKFNDDVCRKLDEDYSTLFKDKKSVLGIHFRGTDYSLNMNGHPLSLRPEDYYPTIDAALSNNGYDAIFLATDDKEALDNFRERYGGIILCYQDVFRSVGTISAAFSAQSKGYDGKLAGYEVLRDSFTLSKCNGLIAGLSQVSVFSIVYKKSTGSEYSYLEIIDKGMNNNKREWIDEFDYYVK